MFYVILFIRKKWQNFCLYQNSKSIDLSVITFYYKNVLFLNIKQFLIFIVITNVYHLLKRFSTKREEKCKLIFFKKYLFNFALQVRQYPLLFILIPQQETYRINSSKLFHTNELNDRYYSLAIPCDTSEYAASRFLAKTPTSGFLFENRPGASSSRRR